jgi:hypothetical protein
LFVVIEGAAVIGYSAEKIEITAILARFWAAIYTHCALNIP